jgi:hypothetical protein
VPRSSYNYVVTWRQPLNGAQPVMARTVKWELIAALGHFEPDALADLEVWRFADRGAAFAATDRVHLGTAADFLTKERGEPRG